MFELSQEKYGFNVFFTKYGFNGFFLLKHGFNVSYYILSEKKLDIIHS
jgi:hypothetical protein